MKKNLIKLILLFFVSMLTVGASGAMPVATEPVGPDKDYLCFTAEQAGAKVALTKQGSPKHVTIEYSTNEGASWTTVDFSSASTTGEITLSDTGDKVYFRNANEAKDVSEFSTYSNCFVFATTNKVTVSGNVMSLVDRDVESTTIPGSYCFSSLFSGCTTLTSAADLKLPATTLTAYCYTEMFSGCTALETAPELKATTLDYSCCSKMFYGCTALKTAPAILPATTLTAYCYTEMFSGCTALETAPELRATTLDSYCCSKMFYGCTALKTAPAILPATTLPAYCYSEMFSGCTALETAPELKATTLDYFCCSKMFYGCESLTAVPALPAMKLAASCYEYMFSGCTSLETAELPATELNMSCYHHMFSGCERLNYVTVGFTAWLLSTTASWLEGAGTKATVTPVFVCPVELDTETTRDASHVPEGWTVKVSVDDIKPYTAKTDKENATVTYSRTFAEAGKYEALYLPFSVTMTDELLDEVAIAQIYMVSTKGSVVGGAQDAGVNVVVVKTLGVGETTDPHTPYFICSKAGTDLEFTQEHTTLYAATEGHIDCSTTMDKYDFIGTYTGETLTPQEGIFIYVMQNGGLHKLASEADLPCNRWKMVKTPRSWKDSYVAPVSQAMMSVITLGEDDTTGIIGIDANAGANLDDAEYNLQGQMLNTVNGYQGVVIRKGQKYLIEQ